MWPHRYICLRLSPDEQGLTLLHYKTSVFSEMNGGQRIHPNRTRTSHHRPLESLLWDANRTGVLNGGHHSRSVEGTISCWQRESRAKTIRIRRTQRCWTRETGM